MFCMYCQEIIFKLFLHTNFTSRSCKKEAFLCQYNQFKTDLKCMTWGNEYYYLKVYYISKTCL